MPYENEHAARVRNPGDFIDGSFRRKNIQKGIDIIMGKLKDGSGSMVTQAYRFKKDIFTAAQAKKWLKDHNISYISFEEAKKMEEFMLYKDISDGAVKDIDTVQGVITGYFSIFGNKDSDGDIVMPGAYKKSLRENGPDSDKPRILHLYMHDPYRPLAKPNVLKEDKKGLYFESQISHTALGKDVIQLYMDKVLTEHSIGYQIIKREVDEASETQKLTELKLWEGSTVSWGANMDALVQTVKTDNMPDRTTWDKIMERFDALETALKGNYTDETARQLEISFKQLQQLIISLARKVEPDTSTQEPVKPEVNVITADWIMSKIKFNINL